MLKTKEETVKHYCEKYKITPEAFEEIWTAEESRAKGFGYEGENIVKFAIKRIGIFFAKKNAQQGEEYRVALIGVKETDYGNTKIYDKALAEWKEDPDVAIKSKICNEKGKPLFQSGKNVGQVMIPDKFIMKSCYGPIQKVVEGEEHPWIKDVKFDLPRHTPVPLNTISTVKLVKGGKEGVFYCNSPDFVVQQELTYAKMIELAEGFYEKLDLKDLPAWAESHKGQYDVVTYSVVDLVDLNFTGEGAKSNVLVVAQEDAEGELATVSSWVSKLPEISLDIIEGAENLLIFHTPFGDTTGILGVTVEDKFRKKVTTEEVKPDNGVKKEPEAKKGPQGWPGL